MTVRPPIAEVYRRADGLWDWRVKAPNGEIVATSGGQGYTERNDAADGLLTACGYMEWVPTGEIRFA